MQAGSVGIVLYMYIVVPMVFQILSGFRLEPTIRPFCPWSVVVSSVSLLFFLLILCLG